MNSNLQNIHRLFTESSYQRESQKNKQVILNIIYNNYNYSQLFP